MEFAGRRLHFNTSHVSINHRCKNPVSFSLGISIHLMFLLIFRSPYGDTRLLYISIHLMFLLIAITSFIRFSNIYFNTSHVSINQNKTALQQLDERDFNTSHVSINQTVIHGESCRIQISIHLMFLLIQRFYQLFRFYYISNSLKIPAFSNFSQV